MAQCPPTVRQSTKAVGASVQEKKMQEKEPVTAIIVERIPVP